MHPLSLACAVTQAGEAGPAAEEACAGAGAAEAPHTDAGQAEGCCFQGDGQAAGLDQEARGCGRPHCTSPGMPAPLPP